MTLKAQYHDSMGLVICPDFVTRTEFSVLGFSTQYKITNKTIILFILASSGTPVHAFNHS